MVLVISARHTLSSNLKQLADHLVEIFLSEMPLDGGVGRKPSDAALAYGQLPKFILVGHHLEDGIFVQDHRWWKLDLNLMFRHSSSP